MLFRGPPSDRGSASSVVSGSIPPSHFVEAMGSIESGNERTHELLALLLNRMDRLEAQVSRTERRSALAVEPNLPVDPNYVNHVLERNLERISLLLPMDSDDANFQFENYLAESAVEAADTQTSDRVCFLPV
jgi:hypothetical protein